MNNHLTFWIPGLRPGKEITSVLRGYLQRLAKQERPDISHIDLLLTRSDRVNASELIQDDYILHQLNESSAQTSQWPLAKWRLENDELNIETAGFHWLCADPVYIHPDRSDILLLAHEELVIKHDEAQQLASLINQHYQDEPWEIYVATPHRWYIKLQQPCDLKTSPLPIVKGKNIFEYLPSGDDSAYWQKCMNELQMLLHGSDINQWREENDLLPVNSLWLWGHGTASDNLPGKNTAFQWCNIYSDDVVLNGLGLSRGAKVAALPEDLDDVLSGLEDIEGDILFYNSQLLKLLQQNDIPEWLDELQYLEKYWFAPLVKQMKNNPGLQVTLLLDSNEAYYLTGKQLKRWWRLNNKNKLF